MGSQTFDFLAVMSLFESSFVPKSLMSLYEGSGGLVFGGSSQSSSDHRILSPGFSSGGGGGGGGGRLSGASPSSVLFWLTWRLIVFNF